MFAVSVGNGLLNTGGHFSAADTAPHVLRSTAQGYALPFTGKSLPLDRPYDGAEVLTGCFAYRFGAATDLRVLWREVTAPGALKAVVALSAPPSLGMGGAVAAAARLAASAVSGGGRGGEPAAAASIRPSGGLGPALNGPSGTDVFRGGSGAAPSAVSSREPAPPVYAAFASAASFLHAASFPSSHAELRAEMAKVGLDRSSPMEEGTLKGAAPPPPSAAALAAAKRSSRRRRPDQRSFTVHTNTHIAGTAVEAAVKRARLAILKEQWSSGAEAEQRGRRGRR